MTSRTLLFPLAVLVAIALAACSGSGERPAAQRDPVVETNEAVSASADGGADTRPTPVCVPKSIQDCRLYYKTDWGQEECPQSFQVCMADGSGWWPCGERPVE